MLVDFTDLTSTVNNETSDTKAHHPGLLNNPRLQQLHAKLHSTRAKPTAPADDAMNHHHHHHNHNSALAAAAAAAATGFNPASMYPFMLASQQRNIFPHSADTTGPASNPTLDFNSQYLAPLMASLAAASNQGHTQQNRNNNGSNNGNNIVFNIILILIESMISCNLNLQKFLITKTNVVNSNKDILLRFKE